MKLAVLKSTRWIVRDRVADDYRVRRCSRRRLCRFGHEPPTREEGNWC